MFAIFKFIYCSNIKAEQITRTTPTVFTHTNSFRFQQLLEQCCKILLDLLIRFQIELGFFAYFVRNFVVRSWITSSFM